MYDSLGVILVNTVEEIVITVKSYIDLKIAKERKKVNMETKKTIQEGKWTNMNPPKAGNDDHKHHLILQRQR